MSADSIADDGCKAVTPMRLVHVEGIDKTGARFVELRPVNSVGQPGPEAISDFGFWRALYGEPTDDELEEGVYPEALHDLPIRRTTMDGYLGSRRYTMGYALESGSGLRARLVA